MSSKLLTAEELIIFHTFFISPRFQTFTRFVEVGRVVLINYGENKGKICTVIDVVDAKRVSLFPENIIRESPSFQSCQLHIDCF